MPHPRPASSFVICLAVFLAFAASQLAAQVDGSPDPTFGGGDGIASWNGGGVVDVNDVVATESLVIGVGSFRHLAESDEHLHWQAFDTGGVAVASRACYVDTSSLIAFGVESDARVALADEAGRLWIGGTVSFLGSEDQNRALLARFDLGQNGCVLDTTFSSNGWDVPDDLVACNTQHCAIVGLGEIRPATGAVLTPHYVALLAVQVNFLVNRYFLVSFDAAGNLIPSFGFGGYRELDAPGIDGFAGAAHLMIDGLGRPCVYASVYDAEAPGVDIDVYGFRYTVNGDLDTSFFGAGYRNFHDDDEIHVFARDLAMHTNGGWIMSAQPPAGNLYVEARDVDGGAFVIFSDVQLAPGQVLGQSDHKLVLVADHNSSTGTDGFVSRRRAGLGIVPDSSWGTSGQQSYDVDLGGTNSDTVVEAIFWHGRLVVAGRAANPTGTSGFLVRAASGHIFSDGFEAGSAWAWSGVIGLSAIP